MEGGIEEEWQRVAVVGMEGEKDPGPQSREAECGLDGVESPGGCWWYWMYGRVRYGPVRG